MLYAAVFWTDSSNFGKVRYVLKGEFGLVGPRTDLFKRTEKEILVYESDRPTGILGNLRLDGMPPKGIYRVHFNEKHPDGPNIYFHYWTPTCPKSKDGDVMAGAILRIYDMLKPVKVTDSCIQVIENLEELVDSPELVKIPIKL